MKPQKIELQTRNGSPVSLYCWDPKIVHVATVDGEVMLFAEDLVAIVKERQRQIAVEQALRGERESAA